MNNILLAIISMIGFGLSVGLMKIPASKIGTFGTIIKRNLFICLILIPLIIILEEKSLTVKGISIALGISLLGFMPLYFFTRAIQKGPIGIVIPISHSSGLFGVLFAYLIFGDKLSIYQIIGLIINIIGILLITFKKEQEEKKKKSEIEYILLSIFSAILWGLVFLLFKYPVMEIGSYNTAFIVESGILILSFIFLLFEKQSLKELFVLNFRDNRVIFLIACFALVGTIAFNFAISNSDEIGITTAIVFSSPIIGMLIGKTYFKESLTKYNLTGGLLVVIGIIMLTIK